MHAGDAAAATAKATVNVTFRHSQKYKVRERKNLEQSLITNFLNLILECFDFEDLIIAVLSFLAREHEMTRTLD